MAKKTNPKGVLIGAGVALLFFGGIWVHDYLEDSEEQDIIENGVAAKATVVDIVDTGSRSNHDPVCKVVLTVEGQDGTRFRSRVEKVLSAVDLTKFKEGTVVSVRYDPKDHSRIVMFGP